MRFSTLLKRLNEIRGVFTLDAAERKIGLLRQAKSVALKAFEELLAYHELLLFFCAYPQTAEMRLLAERELKRIAKIIKGWQKEYDLTQLEGTGLPYTTISTGFSIDTLHWLASLYPNDVELVYDDGDSLGSALEEFLSLLLPRSERDSIMEPSLTMREWIAFAKGNSSKSDFRWLLDLFAGVEVRGELRDVLFDRLDLRVAWRLSDQSATRTFGRFPVRKNFYHPHGLLKSVDLSSELKQDVEWRRLRPSKAKALIDVCRNTLCVRSRETDPTTYANPHEVYVASFQRSVEVAILGMIPERRLPIESYFGYVAAKNGLPVGYGGGWVFLDRCEMGMNIFESFRGGESAVLFSSILRAYSALFNSQYFTIATYQIGDGNEEAIDSGAYWFYDRLGFRSVDPDLRLLADRERRHILADRSYRTSSSTLRRFSRKKLFLNIDGSDLYKPMPEVIDIGLKVSKWLGKDLNGDRQRARKAIPKQVMRRLNPKEVGAWPENEMRGFNDLSLLAGMIPDLELWSFKAKEEFVSLLRAKGGKREREYVLKSQRHRGFRSFLKKIVHS
ncbi:MAG: hypothetical protein J4G05_05290 [Chlorobi bacterium]|nr:hypothetical protein [Chlorobiota bacterium]